MSRSALLRRLWYTDSGTLPTLPRIAPGFPDHRTCLLHQKLQMLNCCIERKRMREAAVMKAAQSSFVKEDESEEETDDEFYDCDADRPEEETKRIKHSLWNKPVGRLSKHGNLRLLATGEQMFIPVTQEPVPKTEDQLEEDTDVLLKLGTDAHGSELRARMMSASLLSDMESFKAANPNAVIEDFIRWYSPRDWLEEEGSMDEWGQRKGRLSSRMLIGNNTWLQMWDSAKPVPAHRQKRLFDDTREAEKVLHYLASSLAQVAELLMPALAHAAVVRLAKESVPLASVTGDAWAGVVRIAKAAERASREPRPLAAKYEMLCNEVAAHEALVSQLSSLLLKFNPSGSNNDAVNAFAARLVAGREVPVEGCAHSFIGSRLIHLFGEAHKAARMVSETGDTEPQPHRAAFPQPFKREFVMRLTAARPASYSVLTHQMLRAVSSKNEFRLTGAFSEDITFC